MDVIIWHVNLIWYFQMSTSCYLAILNTNRRRPNDNSNYIGIPLEFSEILIIECKCSYLALLGAMSKECFMTMRHAEI